MSKLSFTDEVHLVSDDQEMIFICGCISAASNGIPVIVDTASSDYSEAVVIMTAIHKGKIVVRQFNGPIATNWLQRRIDAFAEHVAAVTAKKPGRKKKVA